MKRLTEAVLGVVAYVLAVVLILAGACVADPYIDGEGEE